MCIRDRGRAFVYPAEKKGTPERQEISVICSASPMGGISQLQVYLEYATLLPCLLPNLLFSDSLLSPILLRSLNPRLTHQAAITSIAIRGGIVVVTPLK